jgi:type I restriction-modification system DNA methylase subunit
MKQTYPVQRGKQTWKQLQEIIRFGYSSAEIFSDFVEVILSALLSLTDNMQYADITERLAENKLTGIYEERYMGIVEKYKENKSRKSGERPMDFFARAWSYLQTETQEAQEDILGDLHESQISLGEHGQFFTPDTITTMMVQMLQPTEGERVSDPACGSGRFFISMAKANTNLHFYGVDVSPICARMSALNMWLFNLNADIYQGNSLSMEMSYLWRIRKGGFIWETKITPSQITRIVEEQPASPEKPAPIQIQLSVEIPPPEQPAQAKKPGKKRQPSPAVQQTLFDFGEAKES